MFEIAPNDLNHLTVAGRITRKPAFSQKLGALTLSIINTCGETETPLILCLDAAIANAAAARIRVGQHVTFEARLESRVVEGKPTLAIIATDYHINNTHDVVRESGHGDGADEFDQPNRPISERYAARSWDAEQPEVGFDIPF